MLKPRLNYKWRLRTRSLELGRRTLIMGVLNVTPDSFSDGGQFFSRDHAVGHALEMLEEGADIIDIGGESTRPGAKADQAGVSAGEELERVLPVVQAVLGERPSTLISVDTYKAEVAQAALNSGAEIVNDVSALRWDSAMASTVAESNCGLVLMHARGRPQEWRDLPHAADIVAEVKADLGKWSSAALRAGVARESIVLDPGFGFGKKFEGNYPLLARFGEFDELGFPLLSGTSRKSFIGRTLASDGRDAPPDQRLYGTLTTVTASILQGAHIVRVHDVRPAVEVAKVADEILSFLPRPRQAGGGAA